MSQDLASSRWSTVTRRARRSAKSSGIWQEPGNFWLEIPISYIRLAIVGVGVILTVLAGMYAPWLAELISRLLS